MRKLAVSSGHRDYPIGNSGDTHLNYHYDDAERLSYVTDAENHETHYAYDDAGNLTSVTDANNHATSYTYSLVSQELFLSCC
jgi:YD repeat-containing protein